MKVTQLISASNEHMRLSQRDKQEGKHRTEIHHHQENKCIILYTKILPLHTEQIAKNCSSLNVKFGKKLVITL